MVSGVYVVRVWCLVSVYLSVLLGGSLLRLRTSVTMAIQRRVRSVLVLVFYVFHFAAVSYSFCPLRTKPLIVPHQLAALCSDDDSEGWRPHMPAVACSRRRDLFIRSTAILTGSSASSPAHGLSFGGGTQPSRELEFCLVALVRVLYWAQSVALRLYDDDSNKSAYLEARLGAKALLTGKMGSGANGKVYTLSNLQIPGCLRDLETYATAQPRALLFGDAKRSFIEDLAAIVEFDGLLTLTDPSPRASLTLQQYTPKKALYVQRLLLERVVPEGQQLLQFFPESARERSKGYLKQYYSSEFILLEGERPIL
jgi:hypothetical protein